MNEDFVRYAKSIHGDNFYLFLQKVGRVLDGKVPLYQVLNYFGIKYISSADSELQIECLLPTHGTLDSKRSSRYYTDEDLCRVHCFKCGKSLTAFWYFYHMMKDAQGKSVDVLLSFVRDFNVEIDDSFFIKEFKVVKQESLVDLRNCMLDWKAFEPEKYRRELLSFVEKKYVENDE